MPDEAIYAARAETLWREGPWPLLHGAGAGYGLLYPLLAGLPLSVGNFARGYDSLKLLQALVMSLSAVPVFLYGRRLMPPGYALLAAALTVSSPLLLYSGLVMTEVLFYPLSALALLAVARAVETAAKRDQVIALALVGVAIATRVQAVVFLGVFAGAIVVDALFRRAPSRLRTFWPVGLALVVAAAGAAAAPGLFGAYSGTLHGSYPFGLSLRLTYYHLAYAILMVAVVPVAAAAVLFVEAARGRLQDPATRALLAVTGCAAILVSAQVGFFAARYAPHLLGRNLAPLPPLFFVLFAAWLARGAPRPRVAGAATAVLLLAIIVFAPWNSLIVEQALPDSFEAGARPMGAVGCRGHRRDRCGSAPADLRRAAPQARARSAGARALGAHRVVGACLEHDRRPDELRPERAGRFTAPVGRPACLASRSRTCSTIPAGTSSGSSDSGTTASTMSSRSPRRPCRGR